MCNTTEEKVLRKEIGVGNEVLYQLCQDHHILKTNNERYTDGLAAQMWLIGRSYAASPERRGYGVLKGTKVEYLVSGNGLDDYFEKLANELVKELHSGFLEFLTDLEKSNYKSNYKYKLDSSKDDITTLKNNITAVIRFNRLLKEIRFKIDEDDLKAYIENHKNEYQNKTETEILNQFKNNSKNMISFCSKFLHFHFPNTVFIFDSITKSHFKGYGNPYQFNFDDDKSKIKMYKSKKNEDEIIDGVVSLCKELTSQEKEYATHCIREYFLAKEINKEYKEGIWEGKYIPRVIDTYMLIANS